MVSRHRHVLPSVLCASLIASACVAQSQHAEEVWEPLRGSDPVFIGEYFRAASPAEVGAQRFSMLTWGGIKNPSVVGIMEPWIPGEPRSGRTIVLLTTFEDSAVDTMVTGRVKVDATLQCEIDHRIGERICVLAEAAIRRVKYREPFFAADGAEFFFLSERRFMGVTWSPTSGIPFALVQIGGVLTRIVRRGESSPELEAELARMCDALEGLLAATDEG